MSAERGWIVDPPPPPTEWHTPGWVKEGEGTSLPRQVSAGLPPRKSRRTRNAPIARTSGTVCRLTGAKVPGRPTTPTTKPDHLISRDLSPTKVPPLRIAARYASERPSPSPLSNAESTEDADG